MTGELSKTDLKRITALARKQLNLERTIERIEATLKRVCETHRELSTRDLPDALTEAGLSQLVLRNGAKVVIKTEYYASLTGKYRDPAVAWLRKAGFDDLITQELISVFGKGEEKQAVRLEALLRKHKFPFRFLESVHTGAFKALVRERLEAGEQVPVAQLGIKIIDRTKVTPAKPSAGQAPGRGRRNKKK